jgi:MFS family permease
LLIPYYAERGLGFGAARAGVELMAMPLALGLMAPVAGRLADHFGARPLTVSGMALVGAGLFALGALRPGTVGLVLLLAVIGAGLGLFTSPNNAAIMGSAPAQQAGMASGVLNMTRGMGTALGLALTGLVFTVAGGGAGRASADHAFSVTACVLAAIAVAAGLVAALRANGEMADSRTAALE